MIGQQTRTRTSSPARWQKAAERAVAEGIQLRQLAGSGQWVASSGSDATTAYEVEITGNVAHGCGCLAGLNDDPVCKHRAAFYLLIGALALDSEPEPPTAPAAAVACWACMGGGVRYVADCEQHNFPYPVCAVCAGTGTAPLAAQAAALVAAADTGTCDDCGGPLDAEAVTDDAGTTHCGACAEADAMAARVMLLDAISADHRQHGETRLAA